MGQGLFEMMFVHSELSRLGVHDYDIPRTVFENSISLDRNRMERVK